MNEEEAKPEQARPWWANGRASVELFQRHRASMGAGEDRPPFVDPLEAAPSTSSWLSMTKDQERARLETTRNDKKRLDRERRMAAAARFDDRFGRPARTTGEGFRSPRDRGR